VATRRFDAALKQLRERIDALWLDRHPPVPADETREIAATLLAYTSSVGGGAPTARARKVALELAKANFETGTMPDLHRLAACRRKRPQQRRTPRKANP